MNYAVRIILIDENEKEVMREDVPTVEYEQVAEGSARVVRYFEDNIKEPSVNPNFDPDHAHDLEGDR